MLRLIARSLSRQARALAPQNARNVSNSTSDTDEEKTSLKSVEELVKDSIKIQNNLRNYFIKKEEFVKKSEEEKIEKEPPQLPLHEFMNYLKDCIAFYDSLTTEEKRSKIEQSHLEDVKMKNYLKTILECLENRDENDEK